MFNLGKESLLSLLFVCLVVSLSANVSAQTSSSSSSSTSSSSSSSTSSSSSGGGDGYEYNNWSEVCPEVSDGTIVSGAIFDPDNYAGSVVVLRDVGTSYFGGPTSSQGSEIFYSNGTDGNLPMAIYRDSYISEAIDFPPTGSWDTFSIVEIPFQLGANLVSLTEAGGPNISGMSSGFTIDKQNPSGWGLSNAGSGSCPSVQPPKPVEVTCELGTPSIWSNGYVVSNFVIQNVGDRVIDRWYAILQFSQAPQLTNFWNAEFSEYSDNRVLISPLSWNEVLAPGESVHLGFMGSHDGSFETPTCRVNRTSF